MENIDIVINLKDIDFIVKARATENEKRFNSESTVYI